MPSFVSLHPLLKNPPVRQQSTVDSPYEYTYWLPVISSGSTITSVQNAALATGTSTNVAFTDVANNVIMIAYSSGSLSPHGYITVNCMKDTVSIDVITFLINTNVGNILTFKTEIIDQVRVTNVSGVTLGIGVFAGVGSLVQVPNHPYV